MNGFVYVLINPTMPGLAKVGMTMRSSADRIQELSASSGVPTPFVLAYEQPVEDCAAAERWVHAELDQAGYRLAQNREFFRAPLHIVIATVVRAGTIVWAPSSLSDARSEELADQLFNKALAYATGKDGVSPNIANALRYFEKASAHGHATASARAAEIYERGDEKVRRNDAAALKLYRRAVSQGDLFSLPQVGRLYLAVRRTADAEGAWREYFAGAEKLYAKDESEQEAVGHRIAERGGLEYCLAVVLGVKGSQPDKPRVRLPHCVDDDQIALFARHIMLAADERLRHPRGTRTVDTDDTERALEDVIGLLKRGLFNRHVLGI